MWNVNLMINNITHAQMISFKAKKMPKTFEQGIKAAIKSTDTPYIKDSFDVYMASLSKFERLSHEEEVSLIKRVQIGDVEAKRKLTEANLKLVVFYAKKYIGCGTLLLDLIQEGNLGLMRTAEKYDPEGGFKFSAYAKIIIKSFINRFLQNTKNTVRVPVHRHDKQDKLKKIIKKLTNEFMRPPSDEELAEKFPLIIRDGKSNTKTGAEAISILKSIGNNNTKSLDAPIKEGEDLALLDVTEDARSASEFNLLDLSHLRQHLEEAMTALNEKEKLVIYHRFGLDDGGEGKSLEEVGQLFGVTRERIRQIEAKALRKLRHPNRSKYLREYVEC